MMNEILKCIDSEGSGRDLRQGVLNESMKNGGRRGGKKVDESAGFDPGGCRYRDELHFEDYVVKFFECGPKKLVAVVMDGSLEALCAYEYDYDRGIYDPEPLPREHIEGFVKVSDGYDESCGCTDEDWYEEVGEHVGEWYDETSKFHRGEEDFMNESGEAKKDPLDDDNLDSIVDEVATELKIAPEEKETLEAGREWIRSNIRRSMKRYSPEEDQIMWRRYNLKRIAEPYVGQWLLNNGRKIIAVREAKKCPACKGGRTCESSCGQRARIRRKGRLNESLSEDFIQAVRDALKEKYGIGKVELFPAQAPRVLVVAYEDGITKQELESFLKDRVGDVEVDVDRTFDKLGVPRRHGISESAAKKKDFMDRKNVSESTDLNQGDLIEIRASNVMYGVELPQSMIDRLDEALYFKLGQRSYLVIPTVELEDMGEDARSVVEDKTHDYLYDQIGGHEDDFRSYYHMEDGERYDVDDIVDKVMDEGDDVWVVDKNA